MLRYYKLLGARILCSCCCPRRSHRSGHNKTKVILCSATFYLYVNGKCYTFKGQSLENGLPCIFQAIGSTPFYKGAEPA